MSPTTGPNWGLDDLLQNFLVMISSPNLVLYLGRNKGKKSFGHYFFFYFLISLFFISIQPLLLEME